MVVAYVEVVDYLLVGMACAVEGDDSEAIGVLAWRVDAGTLGMV